MTYMTEIFKIIMLVLLIVCAVSVNLTRGLLKIFCAR